MKKEKINGVKKENAPKADIQQRTYIGTTINKQLWLRLRALAVKKNKSAAALLDNAIEKYLIKNEK